MNQHVTRRDLVATSASVALGIWPISAPTEADAGTEFPPPTGYDRGHPLVGGIEWVQQMRADGYVFVCRGHTNDLDSYAIRRDLDEGDDTDQLLRGMRASLRARQTA